MELSHDENFFVWQGWSLLKGEVPYKDFLELKPPMIFFVNALGILSFGLNDLAYRWIFFCLIYPSVVLFYLSLRRFGVLGVFAFLIVLHYVIVIFGPSFHDGSLNETETLGLVFAVSGLALLLWQSPGNGRSVHWTKFIGGFFLGLSILSKEPFLFATVPVLLTYFLFHHENRLANLRSHLVTAIVGGLSAALVICAYLLIRGCFLEYVNTVLAELLYSESYAADTGIFRSNSVWKAAVLSLEILHERYYNFSTLALLLPFYAAFLYRYRLSLFFAVNFVGVALGAYAITLGHCFFSHYFLTGTVGLLSPAIYGGLFFSNCLRNAKGSVRWMLIVLVPIYCYAIAECIAVSEDSFLRSRWYSYSLPAYLKDATDRLTVPGDHILVVDSPMRYVSLNRRHAFRGGLLIDEMIPFYEGSTEDEKLSRVKDEIEKKLPRIIYAPEDGPFRARQQKHFRSVLYPIIRDHRYLDLGKGVFALP
jgi:4-amino-4-deoxy-L-arabinose transferase-like glycosyltransferase